MGADSYNFKIYNNSADDLFAFVYSYNTVAETTLGPTQATIYPQLLLGPIPLAAGSNTIATPTQVHDTNNMAWDYQEGMRIYVTNSEGANGANGLGPLFTAGLATTTAKPAPDSFSSP
jgi:hypothetical protein